LSHRVRLSYIFERAVTGLACVDLNVEKTIMKGLVRFRNFFVTINTFRQINCLKQDTCEVSIKRYVVSEGHNKEVNEQNENENIKTKNAKSTSALSAHTN
jgi:hypothetical protein